MRWKREGGCRGWRGVRRAMGFTEWGPPHRPGFGRLVCSRPHTYWCLIAHSIWQAIDSGQCTRKCDYWEDVGGCMCVCVCLCGRGLHFRQISGTQRKQKAVGPRFIPLILSSKLLTDNKTNWTGPMNQYFAQHGKTHFLNLPASYVTTSNFSVILFHLLFAHDGFEPCHLSLLWCAVRHWCITMHWFENWKPTSAI